MAILATPATATTQSNDLVTIKVEAGHYPRIAAHTLTIEPMASRAPRSQAEVEAMKWRALRTSSAGAEQTTSDDCPDIHRIVAAFRALPAIQIDPPATHVFSEEETLPPGMLDGYTTSTTFQTRTADRSVALVTIRDGVRYQSWAGDAVSALNRCLGSLPG